MNIGDALKKSKEEGGAFSRRIGRAWIAWWSEDFEYRLTYDDLVANDWEPTGKTAPRPVPE